VDLDAETQRKTLDGIFEIFYLHSRIHNYHHRGVSSEAMPPRDAIAAALGLLTFPSPSFTLRHRLR